MSKHQNEISNRKNGEGNAFQINEESRADTKTSRKKVPKKSEGNAFQINEEQPEK